MRLGITGHQKLDNASRWDWVRKELDQRLSTFSQPLIGISSLAVGADQLFATAILEQGGTLEIIVPFAGYEATFSTEQDREAYFDFVKSASQIDILKKKGTNEEAFLAAGQAVVDRSEVIIAVWNGKPSLGLGGTADVVDYASKQKKEILQINPVRREVRFITRSQ